MRDDGMNRRTYHFGICSLTLEFGDITSSRADVIVSSDDYMLTMGGGVSAAIRRAGGEAVLLDAAKKTPATLGDVVVTTAGSLPASYVFHAITIGEERQYDATEMVIQKATEKCFELLDALDLETIAFPAIGAGLAGFSYEDVAVKMAEQIVAVFKHSSRPLHVTIYLYDRYGPMTPIDFIRFFEEFGVQMRAFDSTVQVEKQTEKIFHPDKNDDESKKKPSVKSERQELVSELAQLSQRRDELESTLVRLDGGLEDREQREIERQLEDTHRQRLAVLKQIHEPKGNGLDAFLSYAHEDEKLRVELGKHLRALERQGLIRTWHDRKITPGADWKDTIDTQLEKASLVILLISSDFLDSQYCYEVEMKRALERHDHRESLVIPVILRPVVWTNSPFAKLQVLPKDGKPVVEWPNQDAAFVNITEGIHEAVDDLIAGRA